VLGASLYLIVCTAKNRLRLRLRRLREPRYLVGAAAGAAYLYFTIFARLWGRTGALDARRRASLRRRPAVPPMALLESFRAAGPVLAGMGLLVWTALVWLFPGRSRLFDFTEAEIQFLLPAPVSQRGLLVHRLLRSQLGLFFAAIMSTFVVPSGLGLARARIALAMWIVMLTMRVHFSGVTLMRAGRDADGPTGEAGVAGRRYWFPLMLIAGAMIVGAGVVRAFVAGPVTSVDDALSRLVGVWASAVPRVILWPFAALARPLFSPWPGPYLAALGGAIAVCVANLLWLLHTGGALKDLPGVGEARLAGERRAASAPRVRSSPWPLAASGPSESLFVWKNAVQMWRETSLATAVRYGLPILSLGMVASSVYLRSGGMHRAATGAVLGTAAAFVAVMTVLLGPQIARTDLRQDLLHLELLKTWPVRPSAVIRGEMMWPGVMLTMVAWVAILCASVWWTPAFSNVTVAWRGASAAAAVLAAPACVFAQLTIHNAAAVIFPAWAPLGSSRPRGLDAMGQRLITFTGVLVGLIVMLAPGAIAAGAIWLALSRWIGALVLPVAAAAFSGLILLEVIVATEALGPVYERLDLTAIERAE
jgi:ABC-2 type transport system permease protein